MNFVAPSALRKRQLDEVAPPLSSDAPVLPLPTKIPAHPLGQLQPQLHLRPLPLPSQQQHRYHHDQRELQQHPRPSYGSPPHATHQFQHMHMSLQQQQQQMSPMTPSMSSTLANAPPGRIRQGFFNMMDVQNKSPRKAPTKSRRMSIEFCDDHELKTPGVLPILNNYHHDVQMAANGDAPGGERQIDQWVATQGAQCSPIFVNSGQNGAQADVVMGVVAPGAVPSVASSLQQLQQQQQHILADQKENKTPSTSRVTKPVAMRGYKTSQPSEPTVEPALPSISSYFAPKGQVSTRDGVPGLRVPPPFASSVASKSLHPLGFSRKLPLESPGLTPSNAPMNFKSSFVLNGAIPFEGNGFDSDSDKCSSDEELAMINNEISLSQDKLMDLSVRDIPDHVDGDQALVLTLSESFSKVLTSIEKKAMKDLGIYIISLAKEPSPIMLGRDQFYSVFGEKIRGTDVFHLSRRHCVFHVTAIGDSSSSDVSQHAMSVVVENTSTNGLEFNNRPMKNGERRELQLGDTVTLLRLRNHGEELLLSYTVKCMKKQRKRIDSRLLDRPSIKLQEFSSESGNSELENDVKEILETQRRPAVPQPAVAEAAELKPHADEDATSDQDSTPSPRVICQRRGYREELSDIFGAFSSIEGFEVSRIERSPGDAGVTGPYIVVCCQVNYDPATSVSFKNALKDSSSILLYAGSGNEACISTENSDAMPERLAKEELVDFLKSEPQASSKLIVVFTPSVSTGILRGFSVQKCYKLAEFVALNDRKAFQGIPNELCSLFTTQSQEGGLGLTGGEAAGKKKATWQYAPALSASFIPLLTPTFVGREAEVGEVLYCLRTEQVQLCSIKGHSGVGKSSVAICIAKRMHDRRFYQNGVHFFPVEMIMNDIQRSQVGSFQQPTQRNHQGFSYTEVDVKRAVLSRFISDLNDLLESFPSDTGDHKKSALMIFDGCDAFQPSIFREFVVDLILKFPTVQFVITARQDMKVSLYLSKAILERVVHVKGLGEVDSARLLLSMAKGHLNRGELKKSLPDTDIQALSKHPALERLKGNPLLLLRLSAELKHKPLNDLKDFASKMFAECA